MPILAVKLEKEERRIPFDVGRSLRDILDATDLRVRSGCGGKGACGLCRVRIEAGETGTPTPNERVYLDTDELDQGIRLACQVVPRQDLGIVILSPARKSIWRNLPDMADQCTKRPPVYSSEDLPARMASPYGVAVDLGTTHISLCLYELSSGRCLAGRYGQNPQVRYGSDVMTRLVAASDSSEQACAMSRQVVEAIGEALFDIAAREGITLERVIRLTLVGNTAMLALLSARNYELLLQPSRWTSPIDCLPDDPDAWAASWGIHPQARVEVIPPLAGFVGSDLLAGVAATRLTETGAAGLFIDFGTNSEIALWDGEALWVTSAAGGPAFEGCGISCGAPAEAGAIYRVGFRDGVFNYAVIGDSEPRGLCGSGLVDLVAGLVRSGLLTNMGRFLPPISGDGFALPRGVRSMVLTKRDVDVFQRAKAAVGTGIQVLLTQAKMEYEDLTRICVGGFFGGFLDIANAQEIGLLPKVRNDTIELCGNTALAGCVDTLFSPVAVEGIKNLRNRARLINLSCWSDFDDLFLANLYLQPMRGG